MSCSRLCDFGQIAMLPDLGQHEHAYSPAQIWRLAVRSITSHSKSFADEDSLFCVRTENSCITLAVQLLSLVSLALYRVNAVSKCSVPMPSVTNDR